MFNDITLLMFLLHISTCISRQQRSTRHQCTIQVRQSKVQFVHVFSVKDSKFPQVSVPCLPQRYLDIAQGNCYINGCQASNELLYTESYHKARPDNVHVHVRLSNIRSVVGCARIFLHSYCHSAKSQNHMHKSSLAMGTTSVCTY